MLHQSEIDDDVTGQTEWCDQLQLYDRAAIDVLDDPQRHMHLTPRSDGEVPHRHAVAHQHNYDQSISGVATAEVERLADHAIGNEVAEVRVDRDRLVESSTLEGVNALHETVLGDHRRLLPIWCAALAPDPGRR